MKNQFIPVNDSMEKAYAFIPTMSKDYRQSVQRLSTPEFFIETDQAVKDLKQMGWKIHGVHEVRTRKNFKVYQHYLKFYHPDFLIKTSNNKKECVANIVLGNSWGPNPTMTFDIGVFRKVCKNGLMGYSRGYLGKIKQENKGIQKYDSFMQNVDEITHDVIGYFSQMRDIKIEPSKMGELAMKALNLRFDLKQLRVDPAQLLLARRPEDQGMDLWSVYNRIQENLTQPNYLVDTNGNLIDRTLSVSEDLKINKELLKLVEAFH